MEYSTEIGTQVLRGTPDALRRMLSGLSDGLLDGNEGPDNSSPYQVAGHLRRAARSVRGRAHVEPRRPRRPGGDRSLDRRGLHPAFGEVTLSPVLATWVVHDLKPHGPDRQGDVEAVPGRDRPVAGVPADRRPAVVVAPATHSARSTSRRLIRHVFARARHSRRYPSQSFSWNVGGPGGMRSSARSAASALTSATVNRSGRQAARIVLPIAGPNRWMPSGPAIVLRASKSSSAASARRIRARAPAVPFQPVSARPSSARARRWAMLPNFHPMSSLTWGSVKESRPANLASCLSSASRAAPLASGSADGLGNWSRHAAICDRSVAMPRA
jgi:hypothetical protein